jgi:DNA-3-methyladenine glycosylase I
MAVNRCEWAQVDDPLMVKYHDEEYGVRRTGFVAYFEKLCLESFQAGLSWRCILHKREAFRQSFLGFDPYKVSLMDEKDIEKLMGNKAIVRNRRKIEAVIKNAKLAIKIEEDGGFESYINAYDNGQMLAKDLKKRGFSFVGETICQAYLTSIGVLKAHEKGCFKYTD